MNRIRFTRHADEKFVVLRQHGVLISKRKITSTIRTPDELDTTSREPLLIAQSELDESHVLRVVFRKEGNTAVVITFYPGRKSQYEKK